MENLTKRKIPFYRRIFTKLVIVISVLSIIPLIISNFLIISTYQEVIDKYFPEKTFFSGQDLVLTYQNVKIQAGLTLLLTLILAIFISIIFSRSLVRPLQRLIKGTRIISKGDLDAKVEVISRDEIGELTSSFNRMVEDLKRSKNALEKEKRSLEIKVKARTKELAGLNQELDTKVKARTKELQERVDELEKFHRVTVGRELKMVELKKEIKRLKE